MNYIREQLIKICERAVVPHQKWHDRDSFLAQKSIQSVYKGLTAGLDFKIITQEDDPDYHSDEKTILIKFTTPIDFDKLEKGKELKIASREDYFRDCDPDYETEMFNGDGIDFHSDWTRTYIPTEKRLDEANGNDWY